MMLLCYNKIEQQRQQNQECRKRERDKSDNKFFFFFVESLHVSFCLFCFISSLLVKVTNVVTLFCQKKTMFNVS